MKEIDSAVKEILKIYGLSGLIPDEQKTGSASYPPPFISYITFNRLGLTIKI